MNKFRQVSIAMLLLCAVAAVVVFRSNNETLVNFYEESFAKTADTSPLDTKLLGADGQLRFEAGYLVRLDGWSVGQATVKGKLDKDDYSLEVRGKTRGLARLFASGEMVMSGEGKIGLPLSSPTFYNFLSKFSKEKKVVLEFENGEVDLVELLPDPDPEEERVEVTSDDLDLVIDPLAGVLMVIDPAQEGYATTACERSFKIYDGKVVYRVASELGEVVASSGFERYIEPNVVNCQISVSSIAGHVEEDPKDFIVSVSYGNVTETHFFVPISMRVRSADGVAELDLTSLRYDVVN